MPRINNIMSTTIDLNTIKASNSLKSLNSAIKATTNAWKANEARAKSVGNYYNASRSRYEGLAKNIENVKSKIQYLSEEQNKLDRTTKQGQEEYNKYTNKIATAEKQLSSMTAQQKRAKSSLDYQKSGLSGLQSSYKSLNELGNSRIAKMRAEGHEYEANRAQLNTYRSSIANLTKQQKLQADELKQIAKDAGTSSEAYKRQEIRLNKTSTTLAKTKNAMNELDTSMKKANPSVFDKIKSKLSGLNGEAKETHRSFKDIVAGSAIGQSLSNAFSNLGGHIKNAFNEGMNLNQAIAKINGRFKSMNLAPRTIRALDKQMSELKSQTNMTGDNVANLQTRMLNWSNIGRRGAMQMTKMIAGVGDSSKLTGDQVEQLGAGLMRVGSTGKVTYSSLSRITKSAPTFMAQLAKGAGMSESHLKALLKTGKVTQTQFQRWMAAAGKYSDTAFKGFGATQAGAIKMIQTRWQKLEQKMTAPIFNAKTSGLQSLKDLMTSPELTHAANAIGKGIASTIGYLDKHKKDIGGVAKDVIHIGVELGKSLWSDFAAIAGDIGKSFGLIHGNAQKSGGPLHTVRLAMDGLAKNKTAVSVIAKAIELMAAAKLVNTANGLFHITDIAKGGFSAVVGLAKGLKGVQDFSKLKGTTRVFAHIGTGVKSLLHPINSLTNVWDHFLIHFSNFKTKISPVTQAFGKAFGKVKGVAEKVGSGVIKGVKAGGRGIGKAGKWLGSKLSSGFKGAVHIAKSIGSKIADAAKSLGSKALSLGKKLGKAISKGIKASTKFGLGKRMATGAIAGGAVAVPEVVNAVKDRHSADKRSKDIGGALGAVAGGTLTSMIPVVGPMLAPIGAIIGKYAGRWGGQAVNHFTKGWQRSKPPKKFWSLENLGWSTHNMFRQVGQWGSKVGRNFAKGVKQSKSFVHKNGKELALAITNPLIGVPALLYKTNPKFRKWANGVAKNIKGGFAKAKKNVHNFNKAVGKNIGNFAKSANKKYKHFTGGIGKVFKKGWDTVYKHSSRGSKQVMRATARFAKRYVRANKKANAATAKNFGNFGKRLKKDHGNLFTAIGQTTKKQLSIEKKHWSTNWKNIHSLVNGVWKGMRTNFHGFYNYLNKATHGGLGKVISGFKSFGSGIKSFWDGLWRGLKNTVKTAMADINGSIKNVKNFFSGKLKVGSLHLAEGTDWRKKYGIPAIVNDAPGANYREGLIDKGRLFPFPAMRNLPFWLLPGQDIVNGKDMADLFRHAYHFAQGSISSSHSKAVISASVHGASSIKSLAKEIKALTGKHVVSVITKIRGKKSIPSLTRQLKKAAKKYTATIDVKVSGKKNVSVGAGKQVINVSVRYSGISKARSAISKLEKAISKTRKSKKINLKVNYSGTLKAKKSFDRLTKSIKSTSKQFRSNRSASRSAGSALRTLSSRVSRVHSRINSLYKALRKEKFGHAIKVQADEAVNSLKGKGNFAKQFESMTKRFAKDLKRMEKSSKSGFKSMWKGIESSSKSGESNTIHELSSFSSRYKHGWSSMEKGVHSTFSHFWSTMRKSAGHGVNTVISILNSAIGKINGVVASFGGNKSAVKKSGYVHYATGTGVGSALLNTTRRPIIKPTWAILNDGHDSPETQNRETLWDTTTNQFGVVHGTNVPMLLHPGIEVLNATESRLAGFTHYAKGTGGLKALYEEAKKNWEKPTQTGDALFSAVNGLTGAISQLAKGMEKTGQDAGVDWWSQLWKMVENKVDDGDGPASGLLKAVEEMGRGTIYSQARRNSDGYFDCSSLVARALHKYFHAGWAFTNGWPDVVSGLWRHAHRISKSEAKPGDPVFWLPDNHVGVYAGHNRYWSAYGPENTHGVGMQSIYGQAAGGPVFGRFNGLNTEGNKNEDAKVKANNAIQKFIRPQVGQGFWKTIAKIAAKYGTSAMGGTLHGPESERAKELVHLLMHADPNATKKGAIAIAGNAMLESTFNSGVVNSIGAIGLWQWLNKRASGLRSYASRHGHSWKSAGVQVSYALHGDDASDRATFRRVLEGHGSISSLANEFSSQWERGGYNAEHTADAVTVGKLFGYAKGGIVNAPQLAMIGEGRGPETVIPWDISQRSRAYKLMATTLAHFESQDDKKGSNDQPQLSSKILQPILDALQTLNQTMMMFATQPIQLNANMRMDSRLVAQETYKWTRQLMARSQINGRSNYSGR